ncbi:MAG: hypothetical protein KDA57_23190 [Planctomycetales bacterium]|nr:hypothetical protein [Planctomycetales bacterium]
MPKQLDAPQRRSFQPLVLDAADVAEILETLSTCRDVKLIADNVEYESAEEFRTESKGRVPTEVRISAWEPYVTIDLYRFSASLHVSTSDLRGTGLFTKLAQLLQKRERKPRFLYSFSYIVPSSWVIQLVFLIPPLKSISYLSGWLLLINILWVVWVLFVQMRRHSQVFPSYRSQSGSFWRRNFDNSVVALLSALVGAIAGAAATRVADRIWPPVTSPSTTAPALISNGTAPVSSPASR